MVCVLVMVCFVLCCCVLYLVCFRLMLFNVACVLFCIVWPGVVWLHIVMFCFVICVCVCFLLLIVIVHVV